MNAKTVNISTGFIRLDAFLKLAGEAPTGGQAKAWIQGGRIMVNGEVCTQRGRKLKPGDAVFIEGEQTEYKVSSDVSP